MKQFKLLFIGLALVLCSFSASAQVLWRAASYGMSVTQVAKAFPDAIEVTGDVRRLSSGAEALLIIENILLVDHSFQARFYFKNKKLEQVTLSLMETHPYQVTLGIFENLTNSLRMKYGKEASQNASRGMIELSEVTWLVGKTNIHLVVFSAGQSNSILNINYQARVSKDADKL